jgi:acyl-CoA thioesterase-1
MIIMRRIILGLSVLALTACDAPQPATGDARQPATTGAAESADSPYSSADAVADTGAADLLRDAVTAARSVVFVGTSLTAGYGVGSELAYPALIQTMIDSAGFPFRVVNAGISGETSAGGLRRIDWSLQQPTDVLVLELGANDALRGLDPDQLRSNLDAILNRARELHPRIALVLIGMEAPPNLGADYTRRFREVYTDMAERHDAALVPFLLDGVAGVQSLNLDDGIHPNAEGQRILARTVWQVVAPVLEARSPG